MSIKKYFENRMVRRVFALAYLGMFALILVVNALNLPFFVETCLLTISVLIVFFYSERYIDQHIEKANKKLFYQLVEELNIGVLNLAKKSSGETIGVIVENLRDHNLDVTRFQEALYSRLGLGLVCFGSDLVIESANTRSLDYLFTEPNAIGLNIMEWLFKSSQLSDSQLQKCEFHLVNVMEMGEIQWKISLSSFVQELEFVGKGGRHTLKLSYIPVFVDKKIEKIHVIIQDISEHKRVQSQAARREQEIEKIFALLKVSDSLFELFMDETRTLFEEIKQDLKRLREEESPDILKISNRMFRSVHTIKANSKLFKLNSIEDVAHEVESYLAALKDGEIKFNKGALFELTKKVMAISEEIYSYASLRKEIISSFDRKKDQNIKYRIQWIRSLLSQFSFILRDPNFEPRHLKSIQKEFGRALSSFDKMSLRDYSGGYNNMLMDIAGKLHKKIAPIEFHLEAHYFDGVVLARINDIVVHCLRNAIDHGIETPKERLESGKSETGTIKILSTERNGHILVVIEDDGKGIDPEKIKKKAIEKGLLTIESAEICSETELIELLFNPGFSTADHISTVSGRGLGMDAARDTARQLHGDISIQNFLGKGTKIFLQIPSNTEELLAPSSIFDLKEATLSIVQEFNSIQTHVELDLIMEECFVFGDRWAFIEKMRQIIREILKQSKQRAKIRIELENHMGRRKVDSHNFYRLQFYLKSDLCGIELAFDGEFQKISKKLEKICGSLILREANHLELNLPSNIPVPFSHYEFPVLLMCEHPDRLIAPIERFFKNLMADWKYEIVTRREGESLPETIKNRAAIVVLEGKCISDYIVIRKEEDRQKDGMLFLTSDDTDVDTLNDTLVLPENIMFAPGDLQNNSLDRALASIILRRFLKEMVKNTRELSERDKEIVGKFAG